MFLYYFLLCRFQFCHYSQGIKLFFSNDKTAVLFREFPLLVNYEKESKGRTVTFADQTKMLNWLKQKQ